MAHLFKKSTTRPMPTNAETFTRADVLYARWTSKGKTRTAPVTAAADGSPRILTESATWYARITKPNGSRIDVPTGCRDKGAAMARLTALCAEQERVRAGIATETELDVSKKMAGAVALSIADYKAHMTAMAMADQHVYNVTMYLNNTVEALGWKTLRNLSGSALSSWLDKQATTPKDPKKPETVMGAVTHNKHINAWHGFAAWLVKHGRLNKNPFTGLAKRDADADPRRPRRAMTPAELAALFDAARRRPLLEAYRGNKGRGKAMENERADLSPATIDAMTWLGTVRATAYKTAALTGLRWGELRSITLGACRLDDVHPHLILQARSEKARRGAQIPVPAGFVPELKDYLLERRARLVGDSGASVVPFPGALDGEPLFDVPESMDKVFKADALLAGLAKASTVKGVRKGEECDVRHIDTRDSAGRVIDVHSLRHSFGTMLAKSGVSLQVAQRAMRHSDPKLTANVYTHLGLMDVAGAVDVLPSLCRAEQTAQVAVSGANSVAPTVAPNTGVEGQNGAKYGPVGGVAAELAHKGAMLVSCPVGAGIRNVAKDGEGKKWRAQQDSNLWPLAPEASALSS